ncbi:unnamed protein product [Adineta steineri]|uniref:Apple domain-containing protein n=1 Tax=Adineta steineri TaxID=433720 RepID=A0A814TQS6_9BILA|nr:unnamed protein product [Adineta steineri]CAF1164627.1 unnamed protein product [Adineta steineri]
MIQIKLAEIVRILSCIYIITTLFSINIAQSYSLEDFDNKYEQRDASVLYIRQLLKRLRFNDDDNLRWRQRTDATPKKCKEIKSGLYYSGNTGPSIDNLNTYQDCMNVCENDNKCYGWSFKNSTKTCLIQTSLAILYTDQTMMGGSCLTPAAKETHCQEVLSGTSYYGNNGATIKKVATTQDCMSQCDASATCMAWSYRASGKICQLMTAIYIPMDDAQSTSGSCIKKQAPYPPISIDTYRQQSLDEHNILRKKHCVPPLVLDPALNDIAQKYAQKLADTHIFAHSGNTFNDEWMGENLYMSGGSSLMYEKGAKPADAWYGEIKDYDWTNPGFGMNTGHFTQLVWKDTTRAGFGRAVTSDNRTLYVVGNYFPGGNIEEAFEDNVLPLC